MREISLLAENLLAFQEGLYTLELGSFYFPEPLVLINREVFYFTTPPYTVSVLGEWGNNMGHCWTDNDRGNAEVVWEKSIQVSFFSPQIAQGQPPNRTPHSAVRGWQHSIDLYITNCCCCLTRKVKYILKVSTKFHGTVYKPNVHRGQSKYRVFTNEWCSFKS